MPPLRTVAQRGFGGGEWAPGLAARGDLALYQWALRTCRNFLLQRHGGASYRPGTRYVAAVKTGTPALLKFVYSAAATYVLEVGAGYLRFIQNGAQVTVGSPAAYAGGTTYAQGDLVSSGGINYWSKQDANTGNTPASSAAWWYPLTGSILEIPTPFLANLDLVRITQDLTTATLTHQDYPPQELVYGGSATSWRLNAVSTTPSIDPPENVLATRGAMGNLTPSYVITSVKGNGFEESIASDPSTITTAAEPTPELPNIITWDAVAGAVEFRVYKDPDGNGVYGYLGASVTGLEKFNDAGYAPDFTLTPPQERVLFAASGDYPHVATYYQQRRVFANSHNATSTVWGSRTGFPSNFSIRLPLQDDDAVTFTPAGRAVIGIQHLIPLERLIMLTDNAEIVVMGDADGVLTPFTIQPQEKGWSGAAARPVPSIIGSTVVFTQYLSRIVRDLVFNETFTGFQSRDLTIFASHLFKHTVLRQDVQIVPDSIVWCVRDDGVLLGLTYLPELEQYGWHRHDTYGGTDLFRDVCVVPEGDQHVVYVVVTRSGLGTYIERFAPRLQPDEDDVDDAIHLDAAITYSGASATSMTGLSHLNGRVVYAWTTTAAGQAVQGPFTVSGGGITLSTAATKAQIGLAITGQLETLALDRGAELRHRTKRIQAVKLIVERSIPGFQCGPNVDQLKTIAREFWKDQTELSNDRFDFNVTAAWEDEARVFIQHTRPTPLTVLAILPQFEVGG